MRQLCMRQLDKPTSNVNYYIPESFQGGVRLSGLAWAVTVDNGDSEENA